MNGLVVWLGAELPGGCGVSRALQWASDPAPKVEKFPISH